MTEILAYILRNPGCSKADVLRSVYPPMKRTRCYQVISKLVTAGSVRSVRKGLGLQLFLTGGES